MRFFTRIQSVAFTVFSILSLMILLVLWAPGCADDPEDVPDTENVSDTQDESQVIDTMPDQTTTDPTTDESEVAYREELSDFADCFDDCTNNTEVIVIDAETFEATYAGVKGVIDGDDHYFEGDVVLGDIDIFKVVARPRTMMEFELELLTPGSDFDPIMYTHNGQVMMTYNDDANSGTKGCRTKIGYPYVNDLGIMLIVEDGNNYNASPNGPYAGGDGFDYLLTLKASPFAPIDAGTVNPGESVNLSGVVELSGDTVYYKLETTPEAVVSVELTNTGSGDFCPVLVPMKSNSGQLEWVTSTECEDSSSAFIDFSGFDDLGTERIFVVEDYNGVGGEDYTFDLVVRAN